MLLILLQLIALSAVGSAAALAASISPAARRRFSVDLFHVNVADCALDFEVCGALYFLTTNGAYVLVRLFAVGACLLLRRNTSESNAHIKAALSKLVHKGVCRAGNRITDCAVIINLQVASFCLSLKGLIVVAALLASVLNLVNETEKVYPYLAVLFNTSTQYKSRLKS